MTNLAFLKQPLDVVDSPGMDGDDPRFAHICDLAEHARFDEAAAEVERLLDERVYDIRTIVYYLYQAFLEGGVPALPEILEGLYLLLDANWDAFGPAQRRERYVDRSLAWFFEKLCDALEYYERKDPTTWERLTTGLEAPHVDAGLDQAERLSQRLAGAEYKNAGNQLSRLVHWLRDRKELLLSQAEEATAMSDDPPHAASVPPDALAGRESLRPPSGHPPAGNGAVTLEVSHRFLLLQRKLEAFERLIAKGEFVKAALVSNDIQNTLESFDPRDYFPKMFAAYGALVNEHVSSLSPHWHDTESTAWKAMEQFYRVDLERFIGD